MSPLDTLKTLKDKPSAVLVLDSGDVFYGYGAGHIGQAAGEVCFNTAMTGIRKF